MSKAPAKMPSSVLTSLTNCTDTQTAMICGTVVISMGLFFIYFLASDSSHCIHGRYICIKFQKNR